MLEMEFRSSDCQIIALIFGPFLLYNFCCFYLFICVCARARVCIFSIHISIIKIKISLDLIQLITNETRSEIKLATTKEVNEIINNILLIV